MLFCLGVVFNLALFLQDHGVDPGADSGEVKWVNFHPPFSEPTSFFFLSYPSNIEIIFEFSDIITKILIICRQLIFCAPR